MLGFPLAFTAPLVLTALAALPAIWLLLRVTPPQPKRVDFPPLRLFLDLLPQEETPARTPWWLMLMRLVLTGFLILAASGPLWNPQISAGGHGPLLLLMDNSFAAAHDWQARSSLAQQRIEAAGRDGRPVAILALADQPSGIAPASPSAALERLRSFKPQPFLPNREAHLESLRGFLNAAPDAEIVWISDGVQGEDGQAFVEGLIPLAAGHGMTILKADQAPALALAGTENTGGRLRVHVVRAEPNGRDRGTVRAMDLKGLPLADAAFSFGGSALETSADFDIPIETRNAIARIEILGESSAGAVSLTDESTKRRRIGLIFGGTIDQAQPLLAPTYYIEKALSPYADIRQPQGAVADAVNQLIGEHVSGLVLADVGGLDPQTHQKVADFVENGGLLLRFAGSRLAAGDDDLVPVPLRRGDRTLGGALSWDTPKTFAPFPRESPFFGLTVPSDIGIRRQILAEPSGELTARTWASLADGTPIVTANRRGKGLIVLFHVTADTTWSNLPLSGLFVDMLRRIVAMAGASGEAGPETGAAMPETAAPRLCLDGFGAFVVPPASARPIDRKEGGRANLGHPPGFYGPADSSLAVNALVLGDRLAPLDDTPLKANMAPLAGARTVDLRMPFLVLALLLFLGDALASLWLGGQLGKGPIRLWRRGGAAAMLALAAFLAGAPLSDSRADEPLPPIARGSTEAALTTRLAYVVTGDAQVDATSKAGLTGLTQVLSDRTALQPGDPVGIDPARDELAFYPILYWPIATGQALPNEDAIRHLDSFMKNGGTVIFDTRDAFGLRPGGAPSAETEALRQLLSTLDIPELEPVPKDHVLTKTFYLLRTFPGRYATGQTWVEALPPVAEGEENRPARAGDGVSPIIITGNDLAAAWAVGPRGEALYPTVGGDPRQREMAFRGGINIVMYALTGNYKADQVHVQPLLDRLGQ